MSWRVESTEFATSKFGNAEKISELNEWEWDVKFLSYFMRLYGHKSYKNKFGCLS